MSRWNYTCTRRRSPKVAGCAQRLSAAGRVFLLFGSVCLSGEPQRPTQGKRCLRCHNGIASIREEGSLMLKQIQGMGRQVGDPEGCTVCHGGNAKATQKEEAHGGPRFWPDPGSPHVNEKTCGLCHQQHVGVQWHSLMMTEAGKIQGVAWSFGGLTGYRHRWGNYAVKNPSDPSKRLGTGDYRRYMERLSKAEPQVFVPEHEPLPPAPADPAEVVKQPRLAAFTYLRNQCLRCHHAVKGRLKRGDYRGMGCSSCHIPYGNEGLYEGGDPAISRKEPGHCLVHTIQSTREAKLASGGVPYSGIPVETCTTCHDRGKRIGVSFQGLMEIPYRSPYSPSGGLQPALHTKHYLAMHQDLHYGKGMLCQDCHTSLDVHSDGFLAAANLGAVEIECADCHGIPTAYPWELPLGYGDEFLPVPEGAKPRGTTSTLPDFLRQGTVFPPKDGYLRTARGNPLGNVVREGEQVVVHTAAGKDLLLKPLKLLVRENAVSVEGRVAMAEIKRHVETMECYSCHAAWVPQCYGCHVKIDYSGGKRCFDWLAAGHTHFEPARAADRGEATYKTFIPGTVHEERSFTRWEDPPLGVNGEGRISPIAPGCQVSVTIVGPGGKPVVRNHIFRGPPGLEGGGPKGQRTIDMSPTQPHTMTKEARSCESCHASEKALGYGIGGGRLTRSPAHKVIVDLERADKTVLPQSARVQLAAVQRLSADWSRVVTEEGTQLQTVGHHFRNSRPLSNTERRHMQRQGVCLSCHREIPAGSLGVRLLHYIGVVTGGIPKTAPEHNSLTHKILLIAAYVQVLGPLGLIAAGGAGLFLFVRKRRRRAASQRKA